MLSLNSKDNSSRRRQISKFKKTHENYFLENINIKYG